MKLTTGREHTLLVEKYRPNKLENFIGEEKFKKSIQKQLDNNDIQNYMFHGKAGGGKTTLAKLIVQNLDCDYLFINASDESGIDTIRNKIKGFAATASTKDIKVVILDEAEFINIKGQGALRALIEQFSKTTRFIMTCNYIDRIIDPLQSRCEVIKIQPPSKKDVAIHLANIMDLEGIKYTGDNVKVLINKFYPDMRKMLNSIQTYSKDGVLGLDETVTNTSKYVDEVINELSKDKPKFKDIRQIIADSNESSFDTLMDSMWGNASKIMPGNTGMLAILINDAQYKSNFALDKEINICALIYNIIEKK